MQTRVNYEPTKFGTRTDLVMDLMANRSFTSGAGDRPDAKNVLLVFTDGEPSIGKWDKKPFVPFSQSTTALEVFECSSVTLFFLL